VAREAVPAAAGPPAAVPVLAAAEDLDASNLPGLPADQRAEPRVQSGGAMAGADELDLKHVDGTEHSRPMPIATSDLQFSSNSTAGSRSRSSSLSLSPMNSPAESKRKSSPSGAGGPAKKKRRIG